MLKHIPITEQIKDIAPLKSESDISSPSREGQRKVPSLVFLSMKHLQDWNKPPTVN